MKMYTNESQTAKLMELGFEEPTSAIVETIEYCDGKGLAIGHQDVIKDCNFNIGELIEMLGVHLSSIYYIKIGFWVVNAEGFEYRNDELIDALYDMIIKLKEEGVI